MTITIELDPDTERRLEELAARSGQNKAVLLRDLVTNGIDDVEDFYLAHAVLGRLRSGEERVFSAEEVRRDLGLED